MYDKFISQEKYVLFLYFFPTHGIKKSNIFNKKTSDFVGTFAKSRKATIIFAICLSVRMEQLGSQWTDFHEI